MSTPALLHQSLTPERYTPIEVATALHHQYPTGFIDFASCELANKVIQATHFYDRNYDTLNSSVLGPDLVPWNGYCNPPGGKLGSRSQQKMFWQNPLNQ